MRLNFANEYKSIPVGGVTILPKFVVLSGLNGSGKTQLLTAISENLIQVLNDDGTPISQKKYIASGTLVPGNAPQANPTTSEQAYQLVTQWADQLIIQGQSLTDENQYINRRPPNIRDARQQKLFPILTRILRASFVDNKKQITKSEVRLSITKQELLEFDQEQVFQQAFSVSFLRYFQDYRQNKINRYLRDVEGERVVALSEEEFFELKGEAPWDLVNTMMAHMELPYKINKPVSPDNNFTAQLTNTANNAVIGFTDLSSGEQTLCSLAIALYQCDQGNQFPDLLLLDEPDAHLHPRMNLNMLRTLQDVILPKVKCGIVLTTHSPTTCALAPNMSLHLMDIITRRPVHSDIDDVLEALCVGLPTLSIRKENERQVFVESDADAEIYGRIYTKLKASFFEDRANLTLNFVSSGTSYKSGSCEQAISLCHKLREAGSTTAYAIIDFDRKHQSADPVFVLGDGEGYSIESFILMPILVLGLLSNRHGQGGGMPAFATSLDLITMSNHTEDEVQALTDGFCAHLEDECKKLRDGSNLNQKYVSIDFELNTIKSMRLHGGMKVDVPEWYLLSNGHELEKLIVKIFPELNQYGSKAGQLMQAVVQYVLCSHLSYCPKPLVETLSKLQV